MLPTKIWNTLRFKSDQDWGQFVQSNQFDHDAIAQFIGKSLGKTYSRYPFFTNNYADQLKHWQEHVEMAKLLNTTVPDITQLTYDPTDESAFYNFLSYHASYHQVARAQAGIH